MIIQAWLVYLPPYFVSHNHLPLAVDIANAVRFRTYRRASSSSRPSQHCSRYEDILGHSSALVEQLRTRYDLVRTAGASTRPSKTLLTARNRTRALASVAPTPSTSPTWYDFERTDVPVPQPDPRNTAHSTILYKGTRQRRSNILHVGNAVRFRAHSTASSSTRPSCVHRIPKKNTWEYADVLI